jgi:TonB family protein
VNPRGRLGFSVAASIGLHLGLLGGAAKLLSPLNDHFLRDAHRGPPLEVILVAAAPPALVVDAALPPLADAVRVFSRRAAPREPPSAVAEAPPAKPETAYYSAREVDVRAVPLGEIVPINPDLSGRESGVVVLRVLINAGGSVDNVLVLKAEPASSFGPHVLLPFKQARFLPARKAGIAVNSEMLIELRYGPLEEGKP